MDARISSGDRRNPFLVLHSCSGSFCCPRPQQVGASEKITDLNSETSYSLRYKSSLSNSRYCNKFWRSSSVKLNYSSVRSNGFGFRARTNTYHNIPIMRNSCLRKKFDCRSYLWYNICLLDRKTIFVPSKCPIRSPA